MSVFLIALGAILRYAVTDTIDAVNLKTIGLILIIAGILGLVISLVRVAMYRRAREREVVERDVVDRRPLR